MFDNHIISASNLLTTQFADPFKLKKEQKLSMLMENVINGVIFIFILVKYHYIHHSDFVIIEIEYQCIHSLNTGNSNKILQETFH